MSETQTSLTARDRAVWRDTLEKNHCTTQEIWLELFKKHTNKPSTTYRESMEGALCYGWVDGLRKRIDNERYSCRFSPRKSKSKWSPLNIRIAEELIRTDSMTSKGQAAFAQRDLNNDEALKIRSGKNLTTPSYIQAGLRENEVALRNFQNLAPGFRKQYVLRIGSAKRAYTRQRRINESIELLERNQKLGLK